MASLTRTLETRRRLKLRKQGRKRKNQQSTKSTASYEELFAALGEPSKPQPASSSGK